MDKLNSIEDGIDRDKEFKKVKNGNVKTQVLEYQELYPFDKYPGEFPVRGPERLRGICIDKK